MKLFSTAALLLTSGTAIFNQVNSEEATREKPWVTCDADVQNLMVKTFFHGLRHLNSWGSKGPRDMLSLSPGLANATLDGQTTMQAALSNVSFSNGISPDEKYMVSRLVNAHAPVDIADAVRMSLLLDDETLLRNIISGNKGNDAELNNGLIQAVSLASARITKLLLNAGANPFTKMNEKETCLEYALTMAGKTGEAAKSAEYAEIAKLLHTDQTNAFTHSNRIGSFCRYTPAS